MTDALSILLKITIVIFMVGNLLDLGLRLDLEKAMAGLRDLRFVTLSLLWAFVLCPALAFLLGGVLPLSEPYAMGLLLLGLAPCAPLLPGMVDKAHGDVNYAASFMLLASAGTVIYMPIAVPLLVKGGAIGTWAILAQVLFFTLTIVASYALAFGVPPRRKSVLTLGLSTRNCGAALAPLLVAADVAPEATVMVTLGIPMMVLFSVIAARVFAGRVGPADTALGAVKT